jgi:nitroreductase
MDVKIGTFPKQPASRTRLLVGRMLGEVRTIRRRISRTLKALDDTFRGWFCRWAVKHPRWAALYFLANGEFDREFRAVLSGKLAHSQAGNPLSEDAARFTLRRNTHRLEKGLTMRPRRSVFAESYIAETVDAFCRVWSGRSGRAVATTGDPLLRWAQDVLDDYFRVVRGNAGVDEWRQKYVRWIDCHDKKAAVEPEKWIPYERGSAAAPVSFPDMLALAKRRRSVRWYLPQPVPRELVQQAIQVALLSPSACNRQPFVFRIFDDPALVQKVSAVPMGTKGYAHNVPAIAVIVGQQRAYFSERDRHLIYIDGALAAMSFMYGLETVGLSSCPINWPDIPQREAQMAALLELAPDERPIMLVSFGYADPAGGVPYSAKKTVEEVCSFN